MIADVRLEAGIPAIPGMCGLAFKEHVPDKRMRGEQGAKIIGHRMTYGLVATTGALAGGQYVPQGDAVVFEQSDAL